MLSSTDKISIKKN